MKGVLNFKNEFSIVPFSVEKSGYLNEVECQKAIVTVIKEKIATATGLGLKPVPGPKGRGLVCSPGL